MAIAVGTNRILLTKPGIQPKTMALSLSLLRNVQILHHICNRLYFRQTVKNVNTHVRDQTKRSSIPDPKPFSGGL
jgi:hypothetical protein